MECQSHNPIDVMGSGAVEMQVMKILLMLNVKVRFSKNIYTENIAHSNFIYSHSFCYIIMVYYLY